MKLTQHGSLVILATTVALVGGRSTRAFAQVSYGCAIDPTKCGQTAGTRIIGGAAQQPTGQTGGTRISGGAGQNNAVTGGGRIIVGARARGNGAGGSARAGGQDALSGHGSPVALGAGAASPIPAAGIPTTGFGGTAQDLGASARSGAAGTQAIVIGLASSSTADNSRSILALPATGGGAPASPRSPALPLLGCVLAALGLGMRRMVARC